MARKRLQQCNWIKYSNRVCLDNDLRILGSVCKHKVPADDVNLEDVIEDQKQKARALQTENIALGKTIACSPGSPHDSSSFLSTLKRWQNILVSAEVQQKIKNHGEHWCNKYHFTLHTSVYIVGIDFGKRQL